MYDKRMCYEGPVIIKLPSDIITTSKHFPNIIQCHRGHGFQFICNPYNPNTSEINNNGLNKSGQYL